jgi:hypothetical protein
LDVPKDLPQGSAHDRLRRRRITSISNAPTLVKQIEVHKNYFAT